VLTKKKKQKTRIMGGTAFLSRQGGREKGYPINLGLVRKKERKRSCVGVL